MGKARLISLTSDFGTADGYVGAMKGVLCARAPDVALVDISHDVAPFDRLGAFLLLRAALPSFPDGCVHLVVVDPGVGTERKGLIVQGPGSVLVGPDNGVLPGLIPVKDSRIFAIDMAPYPEASPTFHGRDVFAPVAAALATGTPPEDLGSPFDQAARLRLPLASRTGNLVKGEIIHADRFGNLVSNIAPAALGASGDLAVSVSGQPVRFGRTFGDVTPGAAVAYWGSGGLLEIAVREGSAKERFGGKGLGVEVVRVA